MIDRDLSVENRVINSRLQTVKLIIGNQSRFLCVFVSSFTLYCTAIVSVIGKLK